MEYMLYIKFESGERISICEAKVTKHLNECPAKTAADSNFRLNGSEC